jgi:protoporphyrin/coproporphyrin ferrochelatase
MLDFRPRRLCVFLLQLGGPEDLEDIEPFLRCLFEDVLPLPGWLRSPVAAAIARQRAQAVAPLYSEIGGGSPIRANTEAQAFALEAALRGRGFDARVLVAMRYSPPRASAAIAEARRDWSDALWLALPLYPQYSLATTRSSVDELRQQLTVPEQERLLVVSAYPAHDGYLDAVAACVRQALDTVPGAMKASTHVVFSAHGLPLKLVRQGDPYPDHVALSVRGVVDRLGLSAPVHVAYQSRIGPVRWLRPTAVETIETLGRMGVRSVVVVPIAFVSEHIETLHELDIQLRDTAKSAGIMDFRRAPTPGTQPRFISALADIVEKALA